MTKKVSSLYPITYTTDGEEHALDVNVTNNTPASPNVNVHDGGGTAITSTTEGGDQALDVHISNPALPLPTGAATAAKQDTGNASLASIDTKLTSPIAVTGPLTDIQLRASAVPVSVASVPLPAGAATAARQDTGNTSLASIDMKLTNPLPVSGPLTDAQLRATAVPVSAASLPLPTGAATAALQSTGNTSLASIDTKLTSPITVTGPLTDTQLRASAVPVSASALPLPTGASTAALQTTGNTSLASIDSKLTSPITVTGPLTDTQLRASAVPVSAASLPLPSGAATSALQTTGNTSLASIDAKLTNPLPISGTVTANAGTNLNTSALALDATLTGGNQRTKITDGTNNVGISTVGSAQALKVDVIQSVAPPSSFTTATLTNITASATNVTLLSLNTSRLSASVFNDSASSCYIKFGSNASTSSFIVKLFPYEFFPFPSPIFTGRVDAIWDTATGAARILEGTV